MTDKTENQSASFSYSVSEENDIVIVLRREWYRPWKKKIRVKPGEESPVVESTPRGLRLAKI